jgi:hypothetical protein
MLKDVAADLAAQLVAAGLGLVSAQNLFVGETPADESVVPSSAVFLSSSGGSQSPLLGGQRTGIAEPVLQVRVRGDREGFEAAQTLAFGVYGALHLTTPAGYISVVAREAQPFYLGTDSAGRPIFTTNFVVSYRYSP